MCDNELWNEDNAKLYQEDFMSARSELEAETTEPPEECDAHLFEEGPVSKLNGRCRCGVCSRCHHHTANSTQGHYWQSCKVTGTLREFHFCCPDPAHGCELEQGKKQDA